VSRGTLENSAAHVGWTTVAAGRDVTLRYPTFAI